MPRSHLEKLLGRSPYINQIMDRYRGPQPADMSTDEFLAAHARLTRGTEGLKKDLQSSLGPDPEGQQMRRRHLDELEEVEAELHLMRPLVGEAVQNWQGRARLHLYVVPALDQALHSELERQRPALEEASHLVSPVDGDRLHLSLGRVLGPRLNGPEEPPATGPVTDEHAQALARAVEE